MFLSRKLLSRKLIKCLGPRVFYWGLDTQTPFAPKFQTPGGKKAYVPYIPCLGVCPGKNGSQGLMLDWQVLPKFRFSENSQWSALQASLSQDGCPGTAVSSLLWTLPFGRIGHFPLSCPWSPAAERIHPL